jgi:hypothetical protein
MEFLPRNCIDAAKKGAGPQPLSEFRSRSAYVLLAEPGAGKTRCFEEEADAQQGVYIKAREFFYRESKPEWKGKVLFIDGLDEMRAGAGDGRLPLDMIGNKLESLDRPQFRLSCREADWLGSLDREALQAQAPSHDLTVLHLIPLTEEDIETLLVKQLGSAKAASNFVAQAEAAGISELLANPKNLEILLKATSDGTVWPQTRRDAFELACRKLAIEHSEPHQFLGPSPPTDKLLNAAGLINTLLLLADKSGFALRPALDDEFYPAFTEIDLPRELPLEGALKSKLFITDGDGRRATTHRSVAEYLAARYLANEINRKSFPWRRLLSILSGQDGKPVAGLRGLWAWLASLIDGDARRELIDADPVGVILYGDVHLLPQGDKKHLLQSLHRAAQSYPWLLSGQWSLSPFGALAAPDMVKTFRDILIGPARDEAQQTLVVCVLKAIEHGNPLNALAATLESIVRDVSRRSTIRSRALAAWLHVAPPNSENNSNFLRLSSDLRAGTLEDNDDELLGILLEHLYPIWIGPQQIIEYLHAPRQSSYIGSYYMFWAYSLMRQTPNDAFPEILDQLSIRPLSKELTDDHQIRDLLGQLLIQGLTSHGDHIQSNRLYDWLGLGLDEFHHRRIEDESHAIADWLSARPDRYKTILNESVNRAKGQENVQRHLHHNWRQHLYGARPPPDLGLWLLTQAEEADDDEIAEYLLQESAQTLWKGYGNEGLSLELLQTWVAARPRFCPWFEKAMYWPIPDYHFDHVGKMRERVERDATNKRGWISFFLEHQLRLNEGTANPRVMDNLALAYFGRLVAARGDTPHERLHHLFDDDQELVNAALTGLRRCPFRNDLPSPKEIVQLSIKGRRHLISLPCLAGMEEAPENLFELDDIALEKLLAMHFTLGLDKEPEWLRVLRYGMPELFSKALIDYALPTLRSDRRVVFGLSSMTFDQEYEFVAPLTVPALLSKFPLRVKAEQFCNLEYLLKAALRYLADEELLTVIEERLDSKSLEAGQRTLWLTAGFIASPGRFQERLHHHAGKNQIYAQQVAEFLPSRGDEWPFHRRLDTTTLGWLIGLLGTHSVPYHLEDAEWVTAAMRMADLVNSLIAQLGGIPTDEAASALSALASRPELKVWLDALRAAIHEQATLRREVQFRHPEIPDLLRTLENKGPATVADLAALTQENLEILASRIHDGGNNEYEKFWSYDNSNKMLNQPKPENACRNMLMTDLQALLPQHVIAQREAYFVEDKRADIVVSYNAFKVPVEIKKDNHGDLWRGIHDQLIPRYLRDPETEGYGIYVVFWFGGKDMPPPPTGPKPRNPDELAARLKDLLSPEEQRRIAVIVIDCSLPGANTGSNA